MSIISCFIDSTSRFKLINTFALPLVLIFYTVIRICDSQWYVTQYTYLKNFTTADSRSKISFTYELITGFVASIMSLMGAVILANVNIRYAVILIGLIFLSIMVLILDYMRPRIGLKPNQYSKEDLEFIEGKGK